MNGSSQSWSCGFVMKRTVAIASLGVGTTAIFVLWNVFVLDNWRLRLVQELKGETLPRLCSSDFQVVENGSAFVYSAYIDDRPARDFTSDSDSEEAVVRIFAYFLRTMDILSNWKCLFWYEDQDKPIVANISRVTDLNKEDKALRFLVAMVICNLPKNQTSSVLQGISLSSSQSNETNFICVVDLRRSRSAMSQQQPDPTPFTSFNNQTPIDSRRLRSKNETKEDTQQHHLDNTTFTICTTPIHGSHYTVSDIVNFYEVNRIFGAEKFIFYVDDNLDPSIRYCLESYAERGLIEMYAFTPPILNGLYYHGQILSITDCLYRTMYRTKYLINQDIDEVIVPGKAGNWQTLLNDIHTGKGPEYAEQIASYSFRNQFFPMEAVDDPAYSQMFLVKRYNIKALLKTLKESYIYPHEHRSKVMARPERILIWHVHQIYKENLIQKNYTIYHVSPNEALLHHYRSFRTRQKLTTDQRMHKYASLMTEGIHFGMGFCSPIF